MQIDASWAVIRRSVVVSTDEMFAYSMLPGSINFTLVFNVIDNGLNTGWIWSSSIVGREAFATALNFDHGS